MGHTCAPATAAAWPDAALVCSSLFRFWVWVWVQAFLFGCSPAALTRWNTLTGSMCVCMQAWRSGCQSVCAHVHTHPCMYACIRTSTHSQIDKREREGGSGGRLLTPGQSMGVRAPCRGTGAAMGPSRAAVTSDIFRKCIYYICTDIMWVR